MPNPWVKQNQMSPKRSFFALWMLLLAFGLLLSIQLLLPVVAKPLLRQWLEQRTGTAVAIERVAINPWFGSGTVEGIRINSRNSADSDQLQSIEFSIELRSLLDHRIEFNNLEIKTGNLALSRWPFWSKQTPAIQSQDRQSQNPGLLPANWSIAIDRLRATGLALRVDDPAKQTLFIDRIELEQFNSAALQQPLPLRLKGRIGQGLFELSGTISPWSENSGFNLAVTTHAVPLANIIALLPDEPLPLQAGRLDGNFHLLASRSETVEEAILTGDLSVAELVVVDPAKVVNRLTAERFSFNGKARIWRQQGVPARQIELQGRSEAVHLGMHLDQQRQISSDQLEGEGELFAQLADQAGEPATGQLSGRLLATSFAWQEQERLVVSGAAMLLEGVRFEQWNDLNIAQVALTTPQIKLIDKKMNNSESIDYKDLINGSVDETNQQPSLQLHIDQLISQQGGELLIEVQRESQPLVARFLIESFTAAPVVSGRDGDVKIALTAKTSSGGRLQLATAGALLSRTPSGQLDWHIDGLELLPFTDYVRPRTGYQIEGGAFDWQGNLQLRDGSLTLDSTMALNRARLKQTDSGQVEQFERELTMALPLALDLLTQREQSGWFDVKIKDAVELSNKHLPVELYRAAAAGLREAAIADLAAQMAPLEPLWRTSQSASELLRPTLISLFFKSGEYQLDRTAINQLMQVARLLWERPNLQLQLQPLHPVAADSDDLANLRAARIVGWLSGPGGIDPARVHLLAPRTLDAVGQQARIELSL